jgi:hypothetical protein
MLSVVDRNVVKRSISVIAYIAFGVQYAVPLEKLTVPQPTINPARCMEPEGSSPYSQQPAIYPYPEPDESSPHTLPFYV